MDEYPSNSHRAKPVKEEKSSEAKNIEKVVSSEVVRRKKPLGKRFAETFFGGDSKGVATYVMFDVLIPAAKDAVADAVSQGVERTLFGEIRSSARRAASRPGYTAGYTSYDRYSAPKTGDPIRREDPRHVPSRRARARHDFDEIIVPTRVEAEQVIDGLDDLLSRYEQASVADMYGLLGITPAFTDEKWGWTNLANAGVTRVRHGYLLNLPRPEPLD